MEKLYPTVRRVRRPLLPPEEVGPVIPPAVVELPRPADVPKPAPKEVPPQIPQTKPAKTKRDDQPAVK